MHRLAQVLGLGILGLTLIFGVNASQDTKKGEKEEKKEEKKVKGTMPSGFKDLDLSATQKDKIYTLMKEYKEKIQPLEKEIKNLRKQEQKEIFKVLTDDQREKYLKAKGIETKKPNDKEKPTKEPNK